MNKQKHWQQIFRNYLEGQASSSEKKLLDTFFEQHKLDHTTIWNDIEASQEEVKNNIRKKIAARLPAEPAQKVSWSKNRFIRAAAAIITLLTISSVLYLQLKTHTKESANAATIADTVKISTAPGERKQITLPDGSKVHLNSQSEISYSSRFGEATRQVALLGEAFFEVKRDTTRPFEVISTKLTTKVLGTSFNVNSYANNYTVTVATGKVKVIENESGQQHFFLLNPAEKAVFRDVSGTFEKTEATSEADFSWTKNTLEFDNLPFEDAIARIERWYGIKIRYDRHLKNANLTARYEQEPAENVLKSIAFLQNFHYQVLPDGTIQLTKNYK
ncbi:FecR family protein [Pontibacter sp. SGAir0037]|uniref:FecR family protein n=1 Tax=Pontibacter sp. SGAir0037 TaxID=2571030 RepID=UPI0010CCFDC0|nr:FecR family protein [Pontibacter sp. SGAir0037]QCR22257.1 hypothetical protein C1N53_07840 [Pontibacter sp. SGAir0037]